MQIIIQIPYADIREKKKEKIKEQQQPRKLEKKKKIQGCHIMNKAVPTMEPWNHNSSNQEDQNPELN